MDRHDRLYDLALDRHDGRRPGLWVPVIRHLALRRYGPAMILLSQYLDDDCNLADGYSMAGLCRRAWKMGEPIAAQNLALHAFNKRDLAGYRHWLRKAAILGDKEAWIQLRRFETRLPHTDARKIGRLRPYRRDE